MYLMVTGSETAYFKSLIYFFDLDVDDTEHFIDVHKWPKNRSVRLKSTTIMIICGSPKVTPKARSLKLKGQGKKLHNSNIEDKTNWIYSSMQCKSGLLHSHSSSRNRVRRGRSSSLQTHKGLKYHHSRGGTVKFQYMVNRPANC